MRRPVDSTNFVLLVEHSSTANMEAVLGIDVFLSSRWIHQSSKNSIRTGPMTLGSTP
jgi:hypothetical protein